MAKSKIHNIVFYNIIEKNGQEEKEVIKSCIFYRDGRIDKESSFEAGVAACKEFARQRKIQSVNSLSDLFNKENIHMMSGADFNRRFEEFVSHEMVEEDIEDAIKGVFESINPTVITQSNSETTEESQETAEEETAVEEEVADETTNTEEVNAGKKAAVEGEGLKPKKRGKLGVRIGAIGLAALVTAGAYVGVHKQHREGVMGKMNISTTIDDFIANGSKSLSNWFNGMFESNNQTATYEEVKLDSPLIEDVNEQTITYSETEITSEPVQVTAGLMSTAEEASSVEYNARTLIQGDNSYYDDYSFDELQAVTNNEFQKTSMQKLLNALEGYNGTFADAYVEEGKIIRAALKFEEAVALQQAYNDYTKEEVRAYFNGAEVDAEALSRFYKDANLQLTAAHVIEKREHPVDMSMLIDSEEGKAFYNRYHEMFLAAKEATGEEQARLVAEFYAAVRKDFPITLDVRTEGMSHADDYASGIESYKLSVVPMVSAAQMLFRNYKDIILQPGTADMPGEADFFNDYGGCVRALKKYERIAAILLGILEDDKTNPLYYQYKNAIIDYLASKGYYAIGDDDRELTNLDAFKIALEAGKEETGEWSYQEGTSYITSTYEDQKTWEEKHTTTKEETEKKKKPIPDSVKKDIDQQIDQQNEDARQRAQKKAEEERQRRQAEEDEKARKILEDVAQESEDFQKNIEENNNQIRKNQDDNPDNDQPINESDFGDVNVHFDDEHSDEQGNLAPHVENITTDPTGDQTGEDLPDPNATGAEFDKQGELLNDATPQVSEQQTVITFEEIGDTSAQSSQDEDSTYSEESTYESTDTSEGTDNSNADVNNEEASSYIEYVSPDAWIEYSSTDGEGDEDNNVSNEDNGTYIEYVSPDAWIEYSEVTDENNEENVSYAEESVNEGSSTSDSYEEPVYDEPVYEEPVYEEPVYEEPVYEEPVYEEPVYEEPVYEEPSYEEAVEEYVDSLADNNEIYEEEEDLGLSK